MDDVEFSGAYGGVADALVEKLRQHLQEQGGEPNPEQNDSPDEDQPEEDSPDIDQLRRGLPNAGK